MEIICPDCGERIDAHALHAAPVEELAETETVASAEVEVAQINADKEITLARIAAKTEENVEESEAEVLRAELRALKEAFDRLVPSAPDPAPVDPPAPAVVEDAPSEPEIPAPPVAGHDDHEEREPRKSKPRGIGLW